MGPDAEQLTDALRDAFAEQFKLLFQQLCVSTITDARAQSFETGLRIACDGYARAAKLIAAMKAQA
jgi:hypothetical protein